MSHDVIRTFLVEDHLIVKRGLIDLFQQTTKGEIVCVGDAVNEAGALEKIPDAHPDVIVVDLNLEESNGLALIETLLKKNPKERIVVFSMRDTVQTIAAAYRIGVLAYVTKSDSPTVLIEAIRAAHKWETYFVPGMAEKLAVYQTQADKENPRNVLTEKEMELFLMLSNGIRQEDAAHRLGLTVRSVANRAGEIRKALNCVDADFTRIAIKYGLIKSI